MNTKLFNSDNIITYGTIALSTILFLIAGLSFSLSFYAISGLALSLKVTDSSYLAMMFPVIIDGFIIAAIAAYLMDSFQGHWADKPQWNGWLSVSFLETIKYYLYTNMPIGLVIAFTALSIWFNAMHSGQYNIPAIVLSAIAPISLFFASELLASQVRTSAKRNALVTTVYNLQSKMEELAEANKSLNGELESTKHATATEADKLAHLKILQEKYDISLADISEAQAALYALKSEAAALAEKNKATKQDTQVISTFDDMIKEGVTALVLTQLGFTQKEIAPVIGRSEKTVQARLSFMSTNLNGTMPKIEAAIKGRG